MREVVRTLALSVLVGGALAGCAATSVSPGSAPPSADYARPVVAGHLEADDIGESSGLAASQCQDVLWTHNDSGNDPLLFGMDPGGRHLGTWLVAGAENEDWESIASYRDPGGRCSLVIGDIGDNDGDRDVVRLHRIPEPAVSAATARATAANPLRTEPVQTLTFGYPDGSHDAETLLVHPRTSDIYLVTKERKGPAKVFRAEPNFGAAVTGVSVAEVSVPSKWEGLLTDGAFSPDGTRLMLCDLRGGYELVLPDGVTEPDAIWREQPRRVDLGARPQGEAVSYGRDGDSLFASSEGTNSALYVIRRK